MALVSQFIGVMALVHFAVTVSAAATDVTSSSFNTTAIAANAPGCRDSRQILLRLADQTDAHPELLAEARAEADRIWATAGVRLVWQMQTGSDVPLHPDTLYVVLRRRLSARMSTTASAREASDEGGALAWIQFTQGVAGQLIEVSLDAVSTTVTRGPYGERMPELPATGRRFVLGRALGRALGRVIAHEIGHWLLGTGHAPRGLMKAVLTPFDLTQPWPLPIVLPGKAHAFINRDDREDPVLCLS